MGWSERFCQCNEFTKGNDYLCAVCRLLPQAESKSLVVVATDKPEQTITIDCLQLPDDVQIGDILTFAGDYQRRTFWQWLTRQPRRLQQYQVKDAAP